MTRLYFLVSIFVIGLFLSPILFQVSSVHAATCAISSDTTIDATYVSVNSCTDIAITGTPTVTWSGTIDTGGPIAIVVNSGTPVFSGALTLTDGGSSVTVASGATVTHAAEDKNGVQITAPTVTVTGSINTNSKGCGANKGVNGTGDCTTGVAGAPGNSYSGGAHGGSGGSGYYTMVNTGTYGSSTNPTLLGSGGGAGSGVFGGGRVGLIVSGTLTIDGSVVANGSAAGGSGGSIYLKAATLNGSGTITANGGAASAGCNGGNGGGGGGRIAVYYGTAAFSVTSASSITVNAGTGGCSDAKNGTTFILDRQVDDGAGTLTFNGGGLFAAGVDYVRDTINVVSGSYLTCDTELTSLTVSSTNALAWPSSTWACAPTAATSLSIGSNSSISLTSLAATFAGTMGAVKVEGTSLAMSGVAWSLSGASSLALNVASFSNSTASTLTMSQAGSYTAFNTTGALTLTNFTYTGGTAGTTSGETGGHLIFPRNTDLTLTNGKIFANVSSTLASLSIDSTSQMSANGKGCLGAFGPNSSNVCTSATAGYGASYGGAGHGGEGGTGYYSTGGASYGSSTYPILFGSGTANGGAAGGGRVWLTVTGSLTNNGLITANGGTIGGSGGSIYLNAATFAGAGNVSSTGAVGDGGTGCGAGGRIAMIASSFTFSGTSSTIAGATGCTGAAGVGTIYKLSYVAPTTPTLTTPISGIYNVSRTPTLVASSYANSPYRVQASTDWKIASDSLGSTTVWSSLGDVVNLSSITVNGSNGTFSGALLGQTSLATSSTYYAFVRHTNSVGSSDWSAGNVFITSYAGASSTQTLNFDDVTPASMFTYNATNIEVNASGNGYARLKDLGGGAYTSVYYPGWSNYKVLTVTNANVSILTDMQVKVTVSYVAAMQAAFGDVRFASSDGITNLPYWLESKTDSSSAIFWVKVPSLAASTTTDIRMYYGNADATSASSGTDTFTYFDDFSDGSASDWSSFAVHAAAPTASVVDGMLQLAGASSEGGVYYPGYAFTNGIIEANMILDQRTGNGQDTYIAARGSSGMANFYRFGPYWAGSAEAGIARESGHTQLNFSAFDYGNAVTRKLTFQLNDSSLNGKIDNISYGTATDANYTSGYIGFGLDSYHENGTNMQIRIDDVRVRQYVATAPTVSFGDQQTAGAFSGVTLVPTTSNPEYVSLHRLEEDLMPGSTGSVYYQFSTDNTTWKYWNGSTWATAADSTSQANTVTTVNAYLPLFATQIGTGTLYTRIILASNGAQPVGLDALRVFYTPSNAAPDAPSSLGQSTLTDGSTTSTGTPTFSFTLSDPDVADTAKYQIQIDDSADFGSLIINYTSALAAQGSRTFQVGQAAGTGAYTIGSSDQVLTSGSYYWQVKAMDAANAVSSYATANSGAIAFVIDTDVRSVQFSLAASSTSESIASPSFSIVLDQTHFENVTVQYAVSAGNATGEGEDYTLSSGTATIMAGETTSTIPFTVTDDVIAELDETIVITLASPVFASLGAVSDQTVTIVDDDVAGVSIVESAGSTTAAEGGATDTYTVVLSTQPTTTVQFVFTTSTNGVVLSTSTIVFTASNWNIAQTVTVTAFDDLVTEESPLAASVTQAVSSTAIGYNELAASYLFAAVTDNDDASILVTESSGATAVTEGGVSDSYTVVLLTEPTSTVQLIFTTSTYGVTLSHSAITFDVVDWDVPQTITVYATDDLVDESASLAALIAQAVSSSAPGYESLLLSSLSVAVTDNDVAGVLIAESGGGTSVTEGSATDTYTLVLATQPTTTVQVLLSGVNTRDIGVSTELFTFSDSNWNTPQSVTITAVDDDTVESRHTLSVYHAASSTAYGYSAALVVNALGVDVQDNDFLPLQGGGGGGGGAGTGISTQGTESTPSAASTVNPPVVSPTSSSPTVIEPINPVMPDQLVPAAPSVPVSSEPVQLAASTQILLPAVRKDAQAFGVVLTTQESERFTFFISEGSSPSTVALGAGERRALLRDALETMKRSDVPISDLERMASGQIPATRNIAIERSNAPRALMTFKSVFQHAPNFKDSAENLAWNTLMYRIRFPRDLKKEVQGIQDFKRIFKKNPVDPFQWATVRVLAYIR